MKKMAAMVGQPVLIHGKSKKEKEWWSAFALIQGKKKKKKLETDKISVSFADVKFRFNIWVILLFQQLTKFTHASQDCAYCKVMVNEVFL